MHAHEQSAREFFTLERPLWTYTTQIRDDGLMEHGVLGAQH